MREIYIGLMSGTSADAVDAVAAVFTDKKVELLGTKSDRLPNDVKVKIKSLSNSDPIEVDELATLDNKLGLLFAKTTKELMKSLSLESDQVKAIGSHGQTIKHRPNDFMDGFSMQIGNASIIAVETGCKVVSDFRRADIALGGHGAPLVPSFHYTYFGSSQVNRAIVNIGGIANITLLPSNDFVSGYDIGPGNTLIDGWYKQHFNLEYDDKGIWASTGEINEDFLSLLLTNKYFEKQPPKSTGPEEFCLNFIKQTLLDFRIKPEDVQATLTELTAITIAKSISKAKPIDEVFVCGGGCKNTYLMERLLKNLKDFNQPEPKSTSFLGIDPQWVEALTFAWMAKKRIYRETTNLPSVTGAKRKAVLGAVYCP